MAAGAGSAPPPQIFEGLAFCVCEPTGQEGEENKVRTGKRARKRLWGECARGAAIRTPQRRVRLSREAHDVSQKRERASRCAGIPLAARTPAQMNLLFSVRASGSVVAPCSSGG